MRLYRLLLRCYPASFRHEYGEEMARLFGERRRAASLGARTALWAEAIGDALSVAPQTHVDILRQDLRYTWRTLSRTPGFAVAAILVMALGIGATTAVFSVTDRALLRPLPFADPQTLVRVWENVPGYSQLELSPANYRDWTQKARKLRAARGPHGMADEHAAPRAGTSGGRGAHRTDAADARSAAGLGLHGLLSFGVSQRRQEIGVRVALGATGMRVVRLVVGEGLLLAVAGVVAGLGLAYAAARWFESLLAGVQPSDPPIYLAAVVLTAIVTLSGSLVPALRALRLDPVTAIRSE